MGFHTRTDRGEPRATQGLTGPGSDTNLLSRNNASTNNGPHVWAFKNFATRVGPVLSFPGGPVAGPFLVNWFALWFINTSRATQI